MYYTIYYKFLTRLFFIKTIINKKIIVVGNGSNFKICSHIIYHFRLARKLNNKIFFIKKS